MISGTRSTSFYYGTSAARRSGFLEDPRKSFETGRRCENAKSGGVPLKMGNKKPLLNTDGINPTRRRGSDTSPTRQRASSIGRGPNHQLGFDDRLASARSTEKTVRKA